MLGLKEGGGRGGKDPWKEDVGIGGGTRTRQPYPEPPGTSLGWGQSRTRTRQRQQKGRGLSPIGDSGVAAAQQCGSFIFRTGNRCCLAEEAPEEHQCTSCLPSRNLVGTGGTGQKRPDSAPVRAGAAQLGSMASLSAAPAGMGTQRAFFLQVFDFSLEARGSEATKARSRRVPAGRATVPSSRRNTADPLVQSDRRVTK